MTLPADPEESVTGGIRHAEVRRGRMTLLIAYRLSTIRSPDLIVVLGNGRVAEVGTHDQLLATDGVFARLVAAQRMGTPLAITDPCVEHPADSCRFVAAAPGSPSAPPGGALRSAPRV